MKNGLSGGQKTFLVACVGGVICAVIVTIGSILPGLVRVILDKD